MAQEVGFSSTKTLGHCVQEKKICSMRVADSTFSKHKMPLTQESGFTLTSNGGEITSAQHLIAYTFFFSYGV